MNTANTTAGQQPSVVVSWSRAMLATCQHVANMLSLILAGHGPKLPTLKFKTRAICQIFVRMASCDWLILAAKCAHKIAASLLTQYSFGALWQLYWVFSSSSSSFLSLLVTTSIVVSSQSLSCGGGGGGGGTEREKRNIADRPCLVERYLLTSAYK